MNKFTIDELETIYEIWGKLPVGIHIKGAGGLIIKILSLIDNYCDHEITMIEVNVPNQFYIGCKICHRNLLIPCMSSRRKSYKY